ncbi:fatty acid hydroxylase family protein [Maritalea mobilis]|uniref:Fatty acid hydroxylase family protein n=1 Tax=Maritalea mobilis TaxID=483324 RepID=A0A4R6VUS6_9HYPH|nr:sterol desaturase family protein [Maritalea mobilis]TDQ66497.1 fatty acid hydroxylase family protein [Maritalea mobilis]
MNLVYFLGLIFQAALVFTASTLLFDILHFFLHKWENSRFALLREFSRWHDVHHKFLDKEMKVNPSWAKANLWCHLVPEFIVSILGTMVFVMWFDWIAVLFVALIHTGLFALRVKDNGRDINHTDMDRLNGQRGFVFVTPTYHALHHVHPHQFFSSFLSLFDVLFGTNCPIKGRRFLVTGASGAYGQALTQRLEKLGAIIETAKFGEDYEIDHYDRLGEKLQKADVLVLAHGAKTDECWTANYTSFVDLIEKFRVIGKDRLTPPEIWAVGSEIELHGDMGIEALKPYAASKRAFAARAREFYTSPDLTYRHIVPAAFTSRMGKGLMSADVAAALSLFLIKRGFTYVPVTYTTLAVWNYIRFRFIPWPKSVRKAPIISNKSA